MALRNTIFTRPLSIDEYKSSLDEILDILETNKIAKVEILLGWSWGNEYGNWVPHAHSTNGIKVIGAFCYIYPPMLFGLFNKQKTAGSMSRRQLEAAIDRDRQQLSTDFATKGIPFLLDCMASKAPYYSTFLEEKRKREGSFVRGDGLSTYAYQYADRIRSGDDKRYSWICWRVTQAPIKKH
jgi:hypothetical protein